MEANVNSSEHKLGKIGRLLTTALSDVAVPKHSSLCRKICDTWISKKAHAINDELVSETPDGKKLFSNY